MNIQKVFDRFCKNLQNRTGIMTEDNIRYYWFAAMLKEDDELNNYTLEHPYKELDLKTQDILQNEELDLLYENKTNKEFFCFEMKFHRNNTDKSFAKTAAAGSIFNDLQRLQQITNKNAHRYFLYVTDPVMDDYLLPSKRKIKNDKYDQLLADFYTPDKPKERDLYYTDTEPTTFIDRANKSLNTNATTGSANTLPLKLNLKLRLIHHNEKNTKIDSDSFKDKECHVRLYEVINEEL